jgi:polysaccharide export outer membrane protein
MRRRPIAGAIFLSLLIPLMTTGLGAQSSQPAKEARAGSELSADAELEPWNGGRYRLMPSDVIELIFPYVPEFNQVLTVQPDGYLNLRSVGDLSVQGRSLPEIRKMILEVYQPILRDPIITVVLKEFEKPFFIAAGQVKQPGKFELRGRMTVTQALAVAGGLSDAAKPSQVIMFRRFSAELYEAKQIDVKKMLASHDLSEDPVVRPGDTLFVPKSFISQLKPFIPVPSIGLYVNPLVW